MKNNNTTYLCQVPQNSDILHAQIFAQHQHPREECSTHVALNKQLWAELNDLVVKIFVCDRLKTSWNSQ